jgi:hypothetical protein
LPTHTNSFDAFFQLIEVHFLLTFAMVIVFTLFAAVKMLAKNKGRKKALQE